MRPPTRLYSPECVEGEFSEVRLTPILGSSKQPRSWCRRMLGSYQNRRLGGDHGLLERRTTAPAHQRAGAQEDRPGLAHAEGRSYREGYELGNALLLVHEGGRRQALAPEATRATDEEAESIIGANSSVGRPNRDMNH